MSENGKKPALSVIVTNWNAGDIIAGCLKSVCDTVNVPFEIIVVDNASTDASVKVVREKFPEAIVIVNDRNTGYSAANNTGFRRASGSYVMFVNPDVVLRPGAAEKMISFLTANPDVGIIGPEILDGKGNPSFDSKGALPSLCREAAGLFLIKKAADLARDKLPLFRPFRKKAEEYYRESGECEFLSGCCMLLESGFCRSLSGFDEGVPMYLDDIDICFRSRKAGRKNYYLAEAAVLHIKQHSTKKTGDYRIYDVLAIKARDFYYRKHFGEGKAFAYRALVALAGCFLLLADALTAPLLLFGASPREKASVVRKHLMYFAVAFGADVRIEKQGGPRHERAPH